MVKVLNEGEDPSSINKMWLTLIPKKKGPNQASEFRPISLWNVLLITKAIIIRMKLVHSSFLVSTCSNTTKCEMMLDITQSAFVPHILITDNGLIAFECFHFMKKNKDFDRHGFIGLKLVISKAYDGGNDVISWRKSSFPWTSL